MPSCSRGSNAFPALFVLRAGELCPECGEGTNVFALLASGFHDGAEDSTFDDMVLLKDIDHLPKYLLDLLAAHCPGWHRDRENASEPPRLMNHCLRCGATRLVHTRRAGFGLLPHQSGECWNISIFRLPLEDEVTLSCGWSVGWLTDWLDYDHAQPWGALPPVESGHRG